LNRILGNLGWELQNLKPEDFEKYVKHIVKTVGAEKVLYQIKTLNERKNQN